MRTYELSKAEMQAILDEGVRLGYFKFKHISENAVDMLRLAVENTFQQTQLRHLNQPTGNRSETNQTSSS